MAQAVTDPKALIAQLGLPSDLLPQAVRAAQTFPLRVPQPYLDRIQYGDPNDPLLRQILPLGAELDDHPQFAIDPVGDLPALRTPGLLQKYSGRVLVVSTGACAVHCRYCFRRHFPYSEYSASREQWREALKTIQTDLTLSEVIFSGGDPFSLSDERLSSMVEDIDACPHIQRIRFHTRLPIVLPQRIDEPCIAWLSRIQKTKVVVVHVNHPNEIDRDVGTALRQLRDAGCTLLNQSVLLRGVNDSGPVLIALSEKLFEHGVLPYYLHLLDKVQGAAHFDVPAETALSLSQSLLTYLPGYLVPKLVREIPGADSKSPVNL